LSSVPRDRREHLIDELREHVNQARSGLTDESAAGVHEILERIGSPEEIAREEVGSRSSWAPLARIRRVSPWTWVVVLLFALVVETSILVPVATSSNTVLPASTETAGSSSSSSSASVGYDGPAICSPTTDAASSGGSPQTLTHTATKVAHGTIEGKAWSLWSARNQSGAAGLEDGGIVFNGREYGLCPGYPNPSETEMIDTGADAIVYGVVDYPGLATVQISKGSINSFAVGKALPSPHVMIANGVSFYIGTLPDSACSYSYFEVNTTSPSSSTQHNIGFAGRGTGQGYSITNNSGNTGACVTGKLDPLSYSQGVWQLPPGQFSNGLGSGSSRSTSSEPSGAGASANGGLVNDEDVCTSQATDSQSGESASQLTSGETEVTSGTVGGISWSLWAADGQSGVVGIEQGGFVLGGLWYGMCPGAPNPAEFEMIDASPAGIVYGYVANPGSYSISLASSGKGLNDANAQQVNGGTFFVDLLSKSACSYSSLDLTASTSSITDQHHFDFGTCNANQLVMETSGYGSW
jgi:hypothetical protein